MARTLGTMLTLTTYGTWLRGDRRGWVDKGVVYPPRPPLEDADRARLKHPPFLFEKSVRHQAGQAMGDTFAERMNGRIVALAVCSWHVHVVVAHLATPITQQVKCLKDAARWALRLGRPIWGAGYDKRFCFDRVALAGRVQYVQQHNVEDGLPPDPWEFIVPLDEYLKTIRE